MYIHVTNFIYIYKYIYIYIYLYDIISILHIHEKIIIFFHGTCQSHPFFTNYLDCYVTVRSITKLIFVILT